MSGKACRHCGETKEAAAFPANPRMADGLKSWCRACSAQATRRWRERNPEYVDAYNAGRRVVPRFIREHSGRAV